MKPPKPLGKLSTAGRSSQIVVSGEASTNFMTSNMAASQQVATSTMKVQKRAPPNKNRASEPGIPWSANDYPGGETFKTSNELRTSAVAGGARAPRRDTSKVKPGTVVKIGYKEAEGKHPYMTMNMMHLQDPQLGRRRAGPTAMPAPSFFPPSAAVNPITGQEKLGPAPIFERYNPTGTKTRLSRDIGYKDYNVASSTKQFKSEQNTKYDLMGYTVARKQNPNPNATQNFPRPQLSTLGAIRPPD